MRRVVTWIPILTLVAVLIGYLARDSLAPPTEELVIEPPPAAKIPPLEVAERPRSLTGRVVDPGDQGVGSALVWLRAGDAPHWTYTEADGSFHLSELEVGPWSAIVMAIGFAPLALTIEETPDPLTIRFEKPFGPLPAMPPIVRADLAGTVTSRLPGPLEGCEVVLIPTLPPVSLSAPLPRRALVRPDGTFEFPELVAGDYQVEVRPEWAQGGSWPNLAPQARTFVHAVPDAARAPVRLEIELATGDVAGKLVNIDFETIEGGLLLLAQGSDPGRVWPTVESGPDGSFSLQGIPAGQYTLTARAGAATFVQEIEVRAGETTTLGVAPLEIRRGH